MKRAFLLVLCLCMGLCSSASGSSRLTYVMGSGPGSVESFVPTKPRLFEVHGRGASAKGSFTLNENGDGLQVMGKASFDLNTLDTGIALRNKHLREKYLQTDKFPEAVLELKTLRLPASFLKESAERTVPFQGLLTLHGVQKPVDGNVTLSQVNSQLTLRGDFKINLKDFNVEVPSFAGVTVAEEVRVHVESQGALREGAIQ